jgi:hypothetical protein
MRIADECDDHRDLILCTLLLKCDEDRMKRREFLVATAALLVLPRYSRAQGKRHRLSLMGAGRPSIKPSLRCLMDCVTTAGLMEGT